MDYIFNIKAKLDHTSLDNIKAQFAAFKKDVETKDEYVVKVKAILDTSSLSVKNIQDQLNNQKLTINVGEVKFNNAGLANANHNAQQISQNLNNATSALQQARTETDQLARSFGNTFKTYGETEYRSQLKSMGIDKDTINKSIEELKKLKLVIDSVSFKQSESDNGQNLATTAIKATDQYGRLITLTQQLKNGTEEVNTKIISVTDNIKQQAQAQERATKAYTQQRTEIEKATAAAKEMWALQSDRKNPISGVSADYASKNGAPTLIPTGGDELKSKALEFVEAYNAWIRVIQQANKELKEQGKIADETRVQLIRTREAAETASKSAISERTTQTDFRTKDVAAEIEKASADLTVFEKELAKVKMSLNDLRTSEGDTLRDLLQTAKDTGSSNAFGKYLDQLAIAKAKLREVKAEQDNAGESIKKLQDLTSKGLFAQNPNDDRVKTLRQDISDLATTYQQLQTQFQNEGMTESVRQGFAQLSGQLQSTSERAKELQSSLKSAKDAAALEDRKSNLNNKIETWLRNNTRASESMRQSMKSLQTQIQSADKQTLTHLIQQFNELNRTAQQTGQIGKSFMDTFKEKALKFAGWFNLANAFMMIANEGKQALITFKEVDSILTEISKTSERSAESLEKLGETAFDAASKYGVSVQNYLTGVQEMARAGYEIYGEERSAQLAELALLIQSAGDTTAQAAQEAIIATDAAFQLGGNVEELTKVFNSLNKITNNTAINMNEMAIGIKEAASIAHQYGVSIEDTASLIAIAEARTKQGGAQVGNAIKSLLVTLTDVTNSTVVKAFDTVGVSMYKFVDGSKQLKTPIELLEELSKVFNELPMGDDRRSILLNDIGGMQIYHYVQKCA